MAIEIKMPALSPTMTSGTVAKWLVGEGDQVNSGDVIAEIETDKATMEVESVDDGVMAKILIQAGSENVAVGAVIAMLAADGESVSDVANMNPQPEKLAASASAVETPTAPVQKTAPVQTTAPVTPATPAISQPAADKPRLFASPLARRIAADKGISLEGITGSGPYGRILRRDVEAAPAEPASTYIAPVAQAIGQADGHLRGGSDLVANSQMRKVIAGRLQESKQQAPHFYLTVDCKIDTLLAARAALNAKAPDGVKISVNDMIIRAAAMALMAVPAANASWATDVQPMSHALDIYQTLRDDVVTERNQKENFLQLGPESNEDYFIVPRVVE